MNQLPVFLLEFHRGMGLEDYLYIFPNQVQMPFGDNHSHWTGEIEAEPISQKIEEPQLPLSFHVYRQWILKHMINNLYICLQYRIYHPYFLKLFLFPEKAVYFFSLWCPLRTIYRLLSLVI